MSLFVLLAMTQPAFAKDLLHCVTLVGSAKVTVAVQNQDDATITETVYGSVVDRQQGQLITGGENNSHDVVVRNAKGNILNVGVESDSTLSGYYLNSSDQYLKITCRYGYL